MRAPAPRKVCLQDALDRSGIWPVLAGRCHCAGDTGAAIEAAGFRIESDRELNVGPGWIITNPYRLGRARLG